MIEFFFALFGWAFHTVDGVIVWIHYPTGLVMYCETDA